MVAARNGVLCRFCALRNVLLATDSTVMTHILLQKSFHYKTGKIAFFSALSKQTHDFIFTLRSKPHCISQLQKSSQQVFTLMKYICYLEGTIDYRILL